MNKKLLATLIIPLLGMTACGGNEFKQVAYFSDGSGVLVSEKGYKRSGYVVATYTLKDEELEYINENVYANFPSSFEIAMPYSRGAEEEALPAEPYSSISVPGTMYYLKPNKTTISWYETYTDVAYNAEKRIARFTTHENVKTADSVTLYSTVYVLNSGSTLLIQKDDAVSPSVKWSVKLPKHTFEEKVSERYVQYAEYESVTYTLK